MAAEPTATGSDAHHHLGLPLARALRLPEVRRLMTAPQVTVVIATRDRPRMLREALDSVLDQDYDGDIETVVVYDQSTPDTALEELGRPGRKVRVTTNDRLPGLAGSRNTGIALSSG